MTPLNLDKFGFTLETYGAKKEEIFREADKDGLRDTNFLVAGDIFCGKTFAAKLSVLRQYRENDVFIFNSFGEYNKLVNSLNGTIMAEHFDEYPKSGLVLYDLSNTRFDEISTIVNSSLKNLLKNFNKSGREKILVLDDIYLLDLQFFDESDVLQRIMKNSKNLNLSVIIIANPFKYVPRGLFYLNSLKTWHTVLENTSIKVCFRPGAMLEFGFHDCNQVVNPTEGYVKYPVNGYGNVPFRVIPTDGEMKLVAEI